MTPSLDRAEVATRLACADVQGSSLPLDVGRAAWAAQVVATADAIALALTPPVAGPCPGEDARDDAEARRRLAQPPVAPAGLESSSRSAAQSGITGINPPGAIRDDAGAQPLGANAGSWPGDGDSNPSNPSTPVAPKSEAAKYEPRVGDVVRYDDTNAGDEMIVSRIEGGITYWRYLRVRGGADISSFQPSALRFIRPATPAERAAAGLPSPEATRPTHVRVTGPTGARFVTIGKTYRVIDRDEDCERLVILNDDDERWLLGQPGEINPAFPTWEPATPPATVEPAKGEAVSETVRELLFDIEHAAKWACQPQGPTIEYVKGRLKELAARAHDILTPQVRS